MLCDTVVGHDLARGFFEQAIQAGRMSHAYLLVGPAGVGKRRFADGVTAALLCREGPLRACGECVSCRMLVSGNHPAASVIEPEPGKRVEIDRVRETIEALSIRGEPRRVVILDAADRMAAPAANAFLKTLEEPPPGLLFLLITSRSAHLLDTIISRCHRVPFEPLRVDQFEQVLAQLGIDTAAHPDLHSACGGAPGAALQLVEGIEACGGEERFQELLSGVGCERPETLIDYLPARSKENKRDHTRRLLLLILDGLWRKRPEDPEARRGIAEKAHLFDKLLRDLDGNQNAELVLEEAAGILRRPH